MASCCMASGMHRSSEGAASKFALWSHEHVAAGMLAWASMRLHAGPYTMVSTSCKAAICDRYQAGAYGTPLSSSAAHDGCSYCARYLQAQVVHAVSIARHSKALRLTRLPNVLLIVELRSTALSACTVNLQLSWQSVINKHS